MSLIAEGVVRGTWSLSDADDIDSAVFERFVSEKQRQSFRERLEVAKNSQLKNLNWIEGQRNQS